MSYDFFLFCAQPGVDPLVTARAAMAENSIEINPGNAVPEKETRKKSIADALLKADPSLEAFPFEFEEIAKLQKISINEAMVQFRHIELNGPEDGPGIQITICDDTAELTVPYWHQDEEARVVFATLWEYLKVIEQAGGYQTYDPQLDRIVELATDFDNVTKCYADVVSEL